MQPIYYLPGVDVSAIAKHDGIDRDLLRANGLAYLVDGAIDEHILTSEIVGGPDKGRGALICIQCGTSRPVRFGYFPDGQTWTEPTVGSPAWIGVDDCSPVKPDDIMSRAPGDIATGFHVRLADGNRWNIPILRRPDGSTSLPAAYFTDRGGNIREVVERPYRKLWDDSAGILDWLSDAPGAPNLNEDKARRLDLAVRALGINYRFSRLEQNALGLINSTNWLTVFLLLVDYPETADELAGDGETEADKKKVQTPEPVNEPVGSGD